MRCETGRRHLTYSAAVVDVYDMLPAATHSLALEFRVCSDTVIVRASCINNFNFNMSDPCHPSIVGEVPTRHFATGV